MRNAAFVASILLAHVAPCHAASFDGSWSVLQVCETTSEGARSYTWRYDATVRNGHFAGQYRNKGQSPSLSLDGEIQQDGAAAFVARGISGDSDHNLKFAPSQSPIHFRVVAKFDATSGSGARVGDRKCAFTFKRH